MLFSSRTYKIYSSVVVCNWYVRVCYSSVFVCHSSILVCYLSVLDRLSLGCSFRIYLQYKNSHEVHVCWRNHVSSLSLLLRISLICALRIFSRFRTAFDGRRSTQAWLQNVASFKFKFSNVNINSQCLVLNDRSIDENLKRRQIL
jgi:hypothetical protein